MTQLQIFSQSPLSVSQSLFSFFLSTLLLYSSFSPLLSPFFGVKFWPLI